jgi:hypothetical protein
MSHTSQTLTLNTRQKIVAHLVATEQDGATPDPGPTLTVSSSNQFAATACSPARAWATSSSARAALISMVVVFFIVNRIRNLGPPVEDVPGRIWTRRVRSYVVRQTPR